MPRPERALADDVIYLQPDSSRTDRADPAARADEVAEPAEPGATGDLSSAEGPRPDARDGDRPAEVTARVDHIDFQDPRKDTALVPDRYGDPLREGRDEPVPLFDGPPTREQTRQGSLGDCGVIAALGAVAGHYPDKIRSCVRQTETGDYEVLLHETTGLEAGTTEPTGRIIRLTVTPDLPVYDDNPASPAFAKAEGTAWVAILEKALAGIDQTWTPQRRADWANRDWPQRAESWGVAEDPLPEGYVRLNQRTNARDRAEILTQLTGEPATVRRFPDGPDAEKRLYENLSSLLADNKPVLVTTRGLHEGEKTLPKRLVDLHVYEVTRVAQGKIYLRNPWNYRHPEPLATRELIENIQPSYTTMR